jgi:hypothetical protein
MVVTVASRKTRALGVMLLGTVLSIVALAWLVAVVGQWWMLVPAAAVASALAASVLVVVVRLFDDDGPSG